MSFLTANIFRDKPIPSREKDRYNEYVRICKCTHVSVLKSNLDLTDTKSL